MTWKYHPVQLDELEAVARAATPGPWIEDDGNVFDRPTQAALERFFESGQDDDPNAERPNPFVCTTTQESANFQANAKFIAKFNPQTCLRLIAWVRSLERNEYRKDGFSGS